MTMTDTGPGPGVRHLTQIALLALPSPGTRRAQSTLREVPQSVGTPDGHGLEEGLYWPESEGDTASLSRGPVTTAA